MCIRDSTDCANGCSVETNKCNPATAGKGECTAGAKRCNLAGEREICSAAGVWESKPCCAKGDSACILTCNSGECSSTLKEGTTRCASSSTYQVFESGAWSAAKNCSADKPVCVPSKATCIGKSDTYSYCGKEQYSEKQTSDQYCSATDGNDFLGYCFEAQGKTYLECGQSCTIDKIGDKKNGLCVQDGNSYFSIDIVCTVVDADHFAYLSDYSTVKECKNGCNADKTGCGDSGSGGGGSTGSSSYTYCGEVDVELKNGQQMKLQAACDQINGAGKTVGVCVGKEIDCINVCQKADVGKTAPVCDIYGTTAGGKAPFAGQAVCTDLSDGTHYGLVEDDSTFKNCKNACNTEGTACDSQGFAEGGSSGGDSSGGGSSSADPYIWCNDAQIDGGGTVGDYCKKNVGENYVGLCRGTSALCFESCTEAQAGQKKAMCRTSDGQSTSFDLVCKSYNGNYAFGLVGTYTECKGSCDAKKESCDAQGGTAGGSEFGSGSGGGSTDSDGSTYYCGNEKDGKQTLDQACTAEMKADAVALCTEQNGTTYRSCYKTCNASDVNKSVDACYPYNDGNSYKVKDVCTKASDTLYIYVDDSKNATLCSGGCNTEGTDCK